MNKLLFIGWCALALEDKTRKQQFVFRGEEGIDDEGPAEKMFDMVGSGRADGDAEVLARLKKTSDAYKSVENTQLEKHKWRANEDKTFETRLGSSSNALEDMNQLNNLEKWDATAERKIDAQEAKNVREIPDLLNGNSDARKAKGVIENDENNDGKTVAAIFNISTDKKSQDDISTDSESSTANDIEKSDVTNRIQAETPAGVIETPVELDSGHVLNFE